MFNLEQSIAEWRQQMLAAGIQTPVPLEELESHLREEIERQKKLGLSEQETFNSAAQKIGQGKVLRSEFQKAHTGNLDRPLAWVALGMFAISFILPAYGDMWGWRCAFMSATAMFWDETARGDLMSIHLSVLTLANLLMIVSPFLLSRFSRNAHSLKWLRSSIFLALALVWSYLLIWFALEKSEYLDWRRFNIGCYIWAASFLLLFLSTFQLRSEKEQYV